MIKPRHVICALGNWKNFDSIQTALETHSFGFSLSKEYSILEANPRMSLSFKVNQDRLPATLDESDWNAVDSHSAVAYILSPPIETKTAENISIEALKIIANMFDHGATAVQSESAGLSHGKQRWLDLAKKMVEAEKDKNEFEIGATLYHSWVQRGLVDNNGLMYTIGMHLLGHFDIEYLINDDTHKRSIQWTDMLGLYMSADRPTKYILEGDGFRLNSNSPERKIITVEDCTRKPNDSFQYNPYGYLRLNPES